MKSMYIQVGELQIICGADVQNNCAYSSSSGYRYLEIDEVRSLRYILLGT